MFIIDDKYDVTVVNFTESFVVLPYFCLGGYSHKNLFECAKVDVTFSIMIYDVVGFLLSDFLILS